MAVSQGVLKAAGCGLEKKVTASCGKSCLNLGPLQSGVWPVLFKWFEARIKTRCKANPASLLYGQASRQYPVHVRRHSGLELVSVLSAASFGKRLLSRTAYKLKTCGREGFWAAQNSVTYCVSASRRFWCTAGRNRAQQATNKSPFVVGPSLRRGGPDDRGQAGFPGRERLQQLKLFVRPPVQSRVRPCFEASFWCRGLDTNEQGVTASASSWTSTSSSSAR